MGKPKIKRKSTLIDMTAMSDVTVLLLTFFMLTSTFLSKEPTTVITPSSVSEEKVPMDNLVTVLVSGALNKGEGQPIDTVPQGRLFIGITGDTDSIYSSEKIRRDLLLEASELYNRMHSDNTVNFTPAQVAAFTKLGMFGVPMKDLPAFLDLPTDKQDALYQYDAKNPQAYAGIGIPFNMNRDINKLNEFQIWMQAMQNVAQRYKNEGIKSDDGSYAEPSDRLFEALKRNGKAIAVKADKDTPYRVVQPVFDNLQTIKLNKFTFMTALKTEAD